MGLIKQDWKNRLIWLVIFMTTAFIPTPRKCTGKNVSSIYKEEVLERLRKRYESNISWNLEKVIKPVLTKHEFEELQQVRLEYPLYSGQGDPFHYYVKATRERNTIVIPIFTVKFLDDLATAVAWLEFKGFTTETLSDYISILKYQEAKQFTNGRYPTPIEALLPYDKMEDNEVDELAQDLLKTTVIYMLSRELGSLYFSRPYTLKKASSIQQMQRPLLIGIKRRENHSRQQDLMLQCDAFALEIMRRIGVPPHRLTFYLSAQTYWTQNYIDFRNEEEIYMRYWRNPPEYAMFPERLHQIADVMKWGKEDYVRQKEDKERDIYKIEQSAGKIYKLSYILEKKSMQWAIKQKASKLRIEDLKPRRR